MSRRFRDERHRVSTRALSSTCRRIALALAAGFMLVVPSSALGAAKGLETDITWGVDSGTQTADANAMSDLGVSWTRITLSWHDVETSKGKYDSSKLSAIDNAVNLARSHGVNIDMAVYQTPQWESGSSDADAPPQNPQDYANFIHAMAARYAGKVAGWEIWNEENLGRFWAGSPSPSGYAQLLEAAYPAVKSADSNALVVFGGMSTNDWQYLESVYNAAPDIGNYFDVMATHPYTPQAAPDIESYDDPSHLDRMSFDGYRTVHQVMLDHGNDKPIWLTEFGWATTSQPGWGVDAQQQADYTKLAYACLQQDPYVQVAFLYELRNNYWANNADDWEDQLGLLNTDWSQKPAYAAFKSTDPNAGGCTYHQAGTQPKQATSTSGSQTSTSSGTATKKSAARKPTVSLRVRTSGAHSAGASKRLKTGVSFTVFGKVQNAIGGSVLLTFQHRVHGRWVNANRMRVRVNRYGAFATKRLKALSAGGWRVRGAYSTQARSSYVYFKA